MASSASARSVRKAIAGTASVVLAVGIVITAYGAWVERAIDARPSPSAIPAAAIPASRPGPCTAADTLLAAGRIVAAEDAYEGLLGAAVAPETAPPDPKTVRCAASGLAAVDQSRCDAGDALQDRDLPEDAVEQYEAALAERPTSACAAAGLADARHDVWVADLRETVLAAWPWVLGLLIAALAVWRIWLRTSQAENPKTPRPEDGKPTWPLAVVSAIGPVVVAPATTTDAPDASTRFIAITVRDRLQDAGLLPPAPADDPLAASAIAVVRALPYAEAGGGLGGALETVAISIGALMVPRRGFSVEVSTTETGSSGDEYRTATMHVARRSDGVIDSIASVSGKDWDALGGELGCGLYGTLLAEPKSVLPLQPEWARWRPDGSSLLAFDKGNRLELSRDYVAAATEYAEAATYDPANAIIAYRWGAMLEHDGARRQALKVYLQAVSLTEELVRPRYRLGAIYSSKVMAGEFAKDKDREALAASIESLEGTTLPSGDDEAAFHGYFLRRARLHWQTILLKLKGTSVKDEIGTGRQLTDMRDIVQLAMYCTDWQLVGLNGSVVEGEPPLPTHKELTELVKSVVSRKGRRSWRVYYNAACFFALGIVGTKAERDAAVKNALDMLTLAVRASKPTLPALSDWIRCDDDLTMLRKRREFTGWELRFLVPPLALPAAGQANEQASEETGTRL